VAFLFPLSLTHPPARTHLTLLPPESTPIALAHPDQILRPLIKIKSAARVAFCCRSGAHVPKIEKRFVLRLQRVLIGVSFGVDRCPCEQDDYGREGGTQPEQGLAGLRRLWQTHHGEVSVLFIPCFQFYAHPRNANDLTRAREYII
jgi:hypothetical protein